MKEGDKFISPCQYGKVKLAGKGSEVRTSNKIRQELEKVEEHTSDHPGEEDNKSDFAEQHQQDAMEAKNDFWSMSGN